MSVGSESAIPFRLASITTEEYAIFKENYKLENDNIGIEFGVDIQSNYKKHRIGVFTSFVFEQEERPLLLLVCGCHFELTKEYWESQTNNNCLTLESDLLTHFVMPTVGTARGIIHAKKPKWLKDFLLPTINISKIIGDDSMTFDLADNEEEEELNN